MSLTVCLMLAMNTVASDPAPTDARFVNLLADMGLRESVTVSCGGELQPGRSDVYAIGVAGDQDQSRYVVVAEGEPPTLLSTYSGQPEIACLSPAQAREQNETIRESEGISGSITPLWSTTVVCGFIDGTSATCWQFSPDTRTFVEVGGWIT